MFRDLDDVFLIGFPVLVIALALVGLGWLRMARDRHALRLWGLRPGREVVRRRGRWHWRAAL